MWLNLQNPVLSPMTGSLILSHKHKAWWMHYQTSRSQTARVKGSAISSCFLQALWWAVRVVCGLDRALTNQEMAVCGFTAPWCCIIICALKFLSFSSVLSLEWLVTWPNLSINFSHKKFFTPSCPPSRPLPPTPIGGHLIQFKDYLKCSCSLLLHWGIWKVIPCCKMCENLVRIATTIGKLQHLEYLKPPFLNGW